MATPWMITRPGSKVGFTLTDPGPASAATITTFTDGDFTCLTTSATLTPTAGTATSTIPGSMCEPEMEIPLPSKSTWTLDLELIQDANDPDGVLAFLLANDGVEGWVYVSTGASDGFPKWVAHVYFSAAAIGGAPATPLLATVSFRLLEAPDVAFTSGVMAAEAEADTEAA
jgi:hypothetical protein